MENYTYKTGFARAAMAVMAVFVASPSALAQSDSESNDNATATARQPLVIMHSGRRGEGSYSFFSRAADGQRMVLLGGGDASEPVVINMDGPGYLITCGQASGGASIAYEFVAAEPRTMDGPDPRTEAAVRRLSEEFARGEPDYDLMTPCMAGTARTQLESLRQRFTSLGPIEAVTFDADWSAQGADAFDVEYAEGSLRWVIAVTADGLAKMWMFHEMR
jgi:hypothetical protein